MATEQTLREYGVVPGREFTGEFEEEPFAAEAGKTGSSRITHPAAEYQAGLDHVTTTKRRFREWLDQHGLPIEPARVARFPSRDQDYGVVFVWANDRLTVVTLYNPLTGECGRPNATGTQEGLVGYMGFEGEREAVKSAYNGLVRSADGGGDLGVRSFI